MFNLIYIQVDVLNCGIWNEYMNHSHYEINLQYEITKCTHNAFKTVCG
jgi:hypothetical protein